MACNLKYVIQKFNSRTFHLIYLARFDRRQPTAEGTIIDGGLVHCILGNACSPHLGSSDPAEIVGGEKPPEACCSHQGSRILFELVLIR